MEYSKINGIDTFWDNVGPERNIVNISLSSGEQRSFCRCGKVSNRYVYTCPSCKKMGTFYSYDRFYTTKNPFAKKLGIKSTSDGFRIYYDYYEITENATTKEFDVVERKDYSIINKTSKGLKVHTNLMLRCYDIESLIEELDLSSIDIKTIDKSFDKDFEDFDLDSFYKGLEISNTVFKEENKKEFFAYLFFIFAKSKSKWFGKKGIYAEKVLGVYITDAFDDTRNVAFVESKTYVDFLEATGIPARWSKFANELWFLEYYSQKNVYRSYSRRYYSVCDVTSFIEKLSDSYKNFLDNIIDHYRFDLETASIICDRIYSATLSRELDDEMSPTFEKYCKDNIVSLRAETVDTYLEDVRKLARFKKRATSENLRDLPSMMNREVLEEMGYDKQRIDLIMESFFDNPMKSSYFLKSKKALTKKEIDAFINQMI